MLYADTPLLRGETLSGLLDRVADGAAVAVLGFEAAAPGEYGRLVRNAAGRIESIVDTKETTAAEQAIVLCNSGVMALAWPDAAPWLQGLSDVNAKGEYHLTDLVAAGREAAVALSGGGDARRERPRGPRDGGSDLPSAGPGRGARRRGDAGRARDGLFAFDTVLGREVTVAPNVVFSPGVVAH